MTAIESAATGGAIEITMIVIVTGATAGVTTGTAIEETGSLVRNGTNPIIGVQAFACVVGGEPNRLPTMCASLYHSTRLCGSLVYVAIGGQATEGCVHQRTQTEKETLSAAKACAADRAKDRRQARRLRR